MACGDAQSPINSRVRPSRARGLRTNTGCITCRHRRVKCDEKKPQCGQCSKSSRSCVYTRPKAPRRTDRNSPRSPAQDEAGCHEQFSLAVSGIPDTPTLDNLPYLSDSGFMDSPCLAYPGWLSDQESIAVGAASEWYNLNAQDAIAGFEKGAALCPDPWRFDTTSIFARHDAEGIRLEAGVEAHGFGRLASPEAREQGGHPTEPWSTKEPIVLGEDEQALLRYYVVVVGPILDLMDLSMQFTNVVPHLAMHNIGLLKGIFAISARHQSVQLGNVRFSTVFGGKVNGRVETEIDHRSNLEAEAAQYYNETLHHLSRNLLHPLFADSLELVATAILISAYEMFHASDATGVKNWERHLRGGFWIQRTQDNNAETESDLRRASWCSWVRQDIWAAFREGRRTLTVFEPQRPLEGLSAEQLATRIILIAARCVDFAAEAPSQSDLDLKVCAGRGQALLQELERWNRLLPDSFRPICAAAVRSSMFPPLWVHPPAFAAAVQMFHFARIVVLLNQPTMGGRNAHHQRQWLLDESVDTICGIAQVGEGAPSAWLNAQALYVAGLAVQSAERKEALMTILQRCRNAVGISCDRLVEDLRAVWASDKPKFSHIV
ncbi:hypothetical protein F5X68DRAFT_139772 [Plectosphaerella plurivora]|uniref:Zn(2)-C6 fungal-type domain-containing protein n=1 Tax=Plectosphaerella plurivora TaxID=936078 RepID=A0A9P8V5C9_9PEZI|nr:hypothetical protein F5X68DRAFT_139772 [Plectosphaerella plurivora]